MAASTRPRAGLRIRVLGPLVVTVDGAPIVVDTRKALAILAVLAVERRPYARDELAALLWPDADDESARGALRRTLSVLRSALGDRWLRIDRSIVALDAAVDVDLVAVEDAAGSTDRRVLAAAAELARRVAFLTGFSLRDSVEFDDWRATRAVAAERSVSAVLDRLADIADSNGDLSTAIDAATRRLALDPLDEAAHRRLMTLLARSGDRGAAIRQYRACVAVLDRELGVAPLAETTELYEAIRDARVEVAPGGGGSNAAPPTPDAIRGPATLPMVGRSVTLEAILAARRAIVGAGVLVLVSGEAGIGKTRLVDAVAEVVRADGGRVLAARAYAAEVGIAYGPIVELLRVGLAGADAMTRLAALPARTLDELERLVELPAGLPGRPAGASAPDTTAGVDPAGRTRLIEALADGVSALAAGPHPGLVVVEDVQWADDSTRAMLAWLARRLAGRSLVLVLTWRPEDLDELGAAFAEALGVIPDARHLALERLDREAVADLVDAAVAGGLPAIDVDRLLTESEGLPLFVVEALLGGHDGRDAPDGPGDATRTVRALLRARLASVSETGTQVLAAGAVIGRSFDAGLVRRASGRSEEETVGALEELVRRGLVREVGGGTGATFDFTHARFRDAVYEGTSLARRRLLHGRTADLLRADAAGRDDPGRLVQVAVHERDAGRDAEAAEAFRAAGLRSRSLYALHEAGSHLESALALGHPDVAGIETVLGEIRTAQGDYAGAVAALEAAAAVADEGGLPAIELRLGRVHARRGDPVTAASHLDAAIEALDTRDDGQPATRPSRTRSSSGRTSPSRRATSASRADPADGRSRSLVRVATSPPKARHTGCSASSLASRAISARHAPRCA